MSGTCDLEKDEFCTTTKKNLTHHHEKTPSTSYMSEISKFFSTTEAQIGTFALTLGATVIAAPYIKNALQTPQAKAAAGMFLTGLGVIISIDNAAKESGHTHNDGQTCGLVCSASKVAGVPLCGECNSEPL